MAYSQTVYPQTVYGHQLDVSQVTIVDDQLHLNGRPFLLTTPVMECKYGIRQLDYALTKPYIKLYGTDSQSLAFFDRMIQLDSMIEKNGASQTKKSHYYPKTQFESLDNCTSNKQRPCITVKLPLEDSIIPIEVCSEGRTSINMTLDDLKSLVHQNSWCSVTLMFRLWKHDTSMYGLSLDVKKLTIYPERVDLPLTESSEHFTIEAIQRPNVTELKEDGMFNLTGVGQNLLFIAPSQYSSNEKTTVSKFTLSSRLCRELNGVFDDFDWSHACISGGLLTGLSEKKYQSSVYGDSDIDLFIYGKDVEETKRYFERAFKYFQSKLTDLWVVPIGKEQCMVVNLCSSQLTRPIQLIGTIGVSGPQQLIEHFDLAHCQVAFDGDHFHYTSAFVNAMKTRTTQIMKPVTSVHRLYKTYQRGFSVVIPDHPVNVVNHKKDQHTYQQTYQQTYPLPMNTYGIDIKYYTLDHLLSKEILEEIEKLRFNMKFKEQYVKENRVIPTETLNQWFTKYMEKHTPCAFN